MKIEDKIKILSEYKELKDLISFSEKRLFELREVAMTQIGSGEHGDFMVIIEEQERESFSLKDAKANITPSVWEKISSFVKLTSYKTLKVGKK